MMSLNRTKLLVASSVAALVLAAGPNAFQVVSGDSLSVVSSAHAQGKGQGGKGGGGKGAAGGAGHRGGAGGASSSEGGQGGPSADSDAKGPKYMGGADSNKPGQGERGGKPVWAQEGIPEVELGRLNVARAPAHVIDKALAEAIKNFDEDKSADLYSMTAEDFAKIMKEQYDTVVRVDSPLENLGLFKDILTDGTTQLPKVVPASTIDLAAIFLGSASDKTVSISNDSVTAINTILKLPSLSEAQTVSLAEKAEIVRAAILVGHGE